MKSNIEIDKGNFKGEIKNELKEPTDLFMWEIRFPTSIQEFNYKETDFKIIDCDRNIFDCEIKLNTKENLISIIPLKNYIKNKYYYLRVNHNNGLYIAFRINGNKIESKIFKTQMEFNKFIHTDKLANLNTVKPNIPIKNINKAPNIPTQNINKVPNTLIGNFNMNKKRNWLWLILVAIFLINLLKTISMVNGINITTYIDDVFIPSNIYKNKVYVIVEDLNYYGHNVELDEVNKILYIKKVNKDIVGVERNNKLMGYNIEKSDIKVMLYVPNQDKYIQVDSIKMDNKIMVNARKLNMKSSWNRRKRELRLSS